MESNQLIEALQCAETSCACHRNGTAEHLVHCPSHDDKHPSLSVNAEGEKVLVHCHAGCTQESVIDALRERSLWGGAEVSVKGVTALHPSAGLTLAGVSSAKKGGEAAVSVKDVTVLHPSNGLTLAELAIAKKLDVAFLRSLGLSDSKSHGEAAVKIPYSDAAGNVAAVRYRLGLSKDGARFRWRQGDRAMLYGLDRLGEIRKAGWVLLVEGESDCWTLWAHGLPALGIPGKATWRAEWAMHLAGIDIYLWQEPDAADLVERVARAVKSFRVIAAPNGIKDPSDAHLLGYDIPRFIGELKAQAVSIEQIARDKAAGRLAELGRECAAVLGAEDPLGLIEQEIRRLGYGGDIKPALIVYLAATSRLLKMRAGAMPVHVILLSPPAAGKSWTVNTVARLIPREAIHTIDAGSPRALIYDEHDLRHKVVIFAEADSLPSGEDNPAASAVRNLLQDGRLHYAVVIRNAETGEHSVREIEKEGPTVLITTAVRPLGEQLMSRLFTLELADDPGQVRAALETQAGIELAGECEPSAELISYQAYLQALAPWIVRVPYAKVLAGAIVETATASRVSRDYARLLSLVKSVAVLRHTKRKRDGKGRLVAEMADYVTVRELVNEMYTESVSGTSQRIREVVSAVEELSARRDRGEFTGPISYARVAAMLGINKMAVSRRARAALRSGWLVNAEVRKGHPADLGMGEAMPVEEGLPRVEELEV